MFINRPSVEITNFDDKQNNHDYITIVQRVVPENKTKSFPENQQP